MIAFIVLWSISKNGLENCNAAYQESENVNNLSVDEAKTFYENITNSINSEYLKLEDATSVIPAKVDGEEDYVKVKETIWNDVKTSIKNIGSIIEKTIDKTDSDGTTKCYNSGDYRNCVIEMVESGGSS